jgi:hypothetical protein
VVIADAVLLDNAAKPLALHPRVPTYGTGTLAPNGVFNISLANVVAANIQHIFAVTEQTSEGTRSTAQMVRELSRTAEDLRASVARFKIA